MRSLVTAMTLIGVMLMSGAPRSEVAPPADVQEPVRLTLDQCIALGLEQNPELMMTKSQVDQAKGQTMQAKPPALPPISPPASAR
jgi:outer membrane protein TolC